MNNIDQSSNKIYLPFHRKSVIHIFNMYIIIRNDYLSSEVYLLDNFIYWSDIIIHNIIILYIEWWANVDLTFHDGQHLHRESWCFFNTTNFFHLSVFGVVEWVRFCYNGRFWPKINWFLFWLTAAEKRGISKKTIKHKFPWKNSHQNIFMETSHFTSHSSERQWTLPHKS